MQQQNKSKLKPADAVKSKAGLPNSDLMLQNEEEKKQAEAELCQTQLSST